MICAASVEGPLVFPWMNLRIFLIRLIKDLRFWIISVKQSFGSQSKDSILDGWLRRIEVSAPVILSVIPLIDI